MRKKFTKVFSANTSSSTSSADTSRLSQDNQTPVNEIESANDIHTKYQLSVKVAELSKLAKQYGKLFNEANATVKTSNNLHPSLISLKNCPQKLMNMHNQNKHLESLERKSKLFSSISTSRAKGLKLSMIN